MMAACSGQCRWKCRLWKRREAAVAETARRRKLVALIPSPVDCGGDHGKTAAPATTPSSTTATMAAARSLGEERKRKERQSRREETVGCCGSVMVRESMTAWCLYLPRSPLLEKRAHINGSRDLHAQQQKWWKQQWMIRRKR